MKRAIIFLLGLGLFVGASIAQPALMPLPKSVQYTDGQFRLTKEFSIEINGPENQALLNYTDRFWERLSARTTMYFPHFDRFSNGQVPGLIISYDQVAEIQLGMSEDYNLNVLSDKIEINATSQVGVMRGLETLLQLLSVDREGFYFPTAMINDAPRFEWRGLLLDVCRHC